MTVPYPYQIEGVKRITTFKGRALLADDMGLGKTLQSLLYIRDNPTIRPVIVICPASLKWNWEREAAMHVQMRAEILEGIHPTEGEIKYPHKMVIVNYDILWPWMEYLKGLKPKLIIIDECQALMNRSTKRTKAVRYLCKGVPHVIALSGTPLTNRPAELWPTLNIIRPDIFPSFYPFGMKYCGARRAPWGMEYKGATRLKELHSLLNTNLMIRRRKQDVLKELPEKIRSVSLCHLGSNYHEYDKARREFINWLRSLDPPGNVRAAEKAERLVQIGHLKRLAGLLKLPLVLDWIDSFLREQDGKLVLFAIHRRVIEKIQKRYRSLCVKVDGSTIGKKRQEAVERFQKNPSVRLFIGNVKAAGTGINLTAASTVVFAEIGWTPGEHTQAEDRIHRIGQKNSANIYYLIAHDTIEENLLRIIQEKQGVLSSTLDGSKQINNLDIYDRLTKEILRGIKNGSLT